MLSELKNKPTVRKQLATETGLRQSTEKWFQDCIEMSPVAAAMIDEFGKIVLVNAETEKLFGYTREELLGQTIDVLVPLRFRSEYFRETINYFTFPTRNREHGRDLIGLRKDGVEFCMEVFFNPVQNETGKYALSNIVDVNERKTAQTKLEARASELIRSNTELEQFAYVASHDLQEPLRKVISCCQILAIDHSDKLSGDARQWMDCAIDGAKRMQSLISGLLDCARVTARGAFWKYSDANVACCTALKNLSVAIDESSAQITSEPLPFAHVDEAQLVQLFQNLIGNALKYRGPNRPCIKIGSTVGPCGNQSKALTEAEPGCKDLSESTFYVRDNGIGIGHEHVERIFTVFERLHQEGQYSGAGLGLAICKKIVDRHGGRIWVESVPGEGSTFYFTLKHRNSTE